MRTFSKSAILHRFSQFLYIKGLHFPDVFIRSRLPMTPMNHEWNVSWKSVHARLKTTALVGTQASYFIFEKMKLEGFAGAEGDVRLRTVIAIPQSVAGRVVGKGGKNVREIQRSTGSTITLPSVDAAQQAAGVELAAGATGDVQVEVFGNFIATQVNRPRQRIIFIYLFYLFNKTPSTPATMPKQQATLSKQRSTLSKQHSTLSKGSFNL